MQDAGKPGTSSEGWTGRLKSRHRYELTAVYGQFRCLELKFTYKPAYIPTSISAGNASTIVGTNFYGGLPSGTSPSQYMQGDHSHVWMTHEPFQRVVKLDPRFVDDTLWTSTSAAVPTSNTYGFTATCFSTGLTNNAIYGYFWVEIMCEFRSLL